MNSPLISINNVSPLTTKGDLLVYSGGVSTRIAVGTDGHILTADSAQTAGIKWAAPASSPDSSYEITNLTLAVSVAANAMTIAVKTKAASDPSSGDPVKVGFRSATAATGTYAQRTITAATSLVVSSGSTLGFASARTHYSYVYLIDNAGTPELAISGTLFDEGTRRTSTAEGGAGAADSIAVLYSTTARTNVGIRLIARLKHSLTTAGTWDEVPDEISLVPFQPQVVATSVQTNAGQTIEAAGTGEVVVYEDVNYDLQNAYDTSTGVYTCVAEGVYDICANVGFVAATWTEGDTVTISIRKGGSAIKTVTFVIGITGSQTPVAHISHEVNLAVADTIDILVDHNRTGGDTTLNATPALSTFTISKKPGIYGI